MIPIHGTPGDKKTRDAETSRVFCLFAFAPEDREVYIALGSALDVCHQRIDTDNGPVH